MNWAKLIEQFLTSPEFKTVAKRAFSGGYSGKATGGDAGTKLNALAARLTEEAKALGFTGDVAAFKAEARRTAAEQIAADGGVSATDVLPLLGFLGKGGRQPLPPGAKMDAAKAAEANLIGELAGGSAERRLLGAGPDAPSITTSEPQARAIRAAMGDVDTTAKAARPAFRQEAKAQLRAEGLLPAAGAPGRRSGSLIRPEVDDPAQSAGDAALAAAVSGDDGARAFTGQSEFEGGPLFDMDGIYAAAVGERRPPRLRVPEGPEAGKPYREAQTLEVLLGRAPHTVAPTDIPAPGLPGPRAAPTRQEYIGVQTEPGELGGLRVPRGAGRVVTDVPAELGPRAPVTNEGLDALPAPTGGSAGPSPDRLPAARPGQPAAPDRLEPELWQRNVFGGGEPARGPTNRGWSNEARVVPDEANLEAPGQEIIDFDVPAGLLDDLGLTRRPVAPRRPDPLQAYDTRVADSPGPAPYTSPDYSIRPHMQNSAQSVVGQQAMGKRDRLRDLDALLAELGR